MRADYPSNDLLQAILTRGIPEVIEAGKELELLSDAQAEALKKLTPGDLSHFDTGGGCHAVGKDFGTELSGMRVLIADEATYPLADSWGIDVHTDDEGEGFGIYTDEGGGFRTYTF